MISFWRFISLSHQNGRKIHRQVFGPSGAHGPEYPKDRGLVYDLPRHAPRGVYLSRQPGCAKVTPLSLSLGSWSQETNDSRHALIFGSQKINLHQSGKEFEPKAQDVQPGSADLCFLTDENVEKVLQAFQEARVEVCTHRAWRD